MSENFNIEDLVKWANPKDTFQSSRVFVIVDINYDTNEIHIADEYGEGIVFEEDIVTIGEQNN